jgi:WD40 repeat protein
MEEDEDGDDDLVRNPECPVTGHTDEVNTVAFSADGKRVVSGSDDTLVKIWDSATGAEVSSFVGVRFGEAMGVFCGFGSFPAVLCLGSGLRRGCCGGCAR